MKGLWFKFVLYRFIYYKFYVTCWSCKLQLWYWHPQSDGYRAKGKLIKLCWGVICSTCSCDTFRWWCGSSSSMVELSWRSWVMVSLSFGTRLKQFGTQVDGTFLQWFGSEKSWGWRSSRKSLCRSAHTTGGLAVAHSNWLHMPSWSKWLAPKSDCLSLNQQFVLKCYHNSTKFSKKTCTSWVSQYPIEDVSGPTRIERRVRRVCPDAQEKRSLLFLSVHSTEELPELSIRIGIHTGSSLVGNIGSESILGWNIPTRGIPTGEKNKNTTARGEWSTAVRVSGCWSWTQNITIGRQLKKIKIHNHW